MIHRKLSALLVTLAFVVCSMPVRAQERDVTTTKRENVELQEKAIKLLESLAGQLGSLQSAENRARIGSNIAGSLWKHDEQRARTILASVEEDIRAAFRPVEYYDARRSHTLLVFLKLRADTVERIAKHDPKAATAFFKTTAPDLGEKMPYNAERAERALEMQLAKQIAAESPEMAVELGRKSLTARLSNDVLDILRRVSRKDKEQARILHKEIVNKVKTLDSPTDSEDGFTLSLVHSFTPPMADEATFRELINHLITLALKTGCGDKPADEENDYDRSWACRWVGSMLGLMEKVDPVRAAKLKDWKLSSEVAEVAEGAYQAYMELHDLTKSGNLEELLALGSKYPGIANEIYSKAVMVAIAANDTEKARKIADEMVTDPNVQSWLVNQINDANEWRSINDENLGKLQKALARTPRIDERAGVLLYAADRMAGSDKKMAVKLLNQAEDLIATMRPGRDQMKAQLTTASMYCMLKSDRGFAILEHLVPKLNELVDAAVKLDGFDTDYMRENEWNMSANGNVGDTLTMLANNAGYFAWTDFDRAVSLASQFDRTEIRLMAQLKLAQGILAGHPTGPVVPKLNSRMSRIP